MSPKEYANKYLGMEVFIFSELSAMAGASTGGSSSSADKGRWTKVRVGSYRLGAGVEKAGGTAAKPDHKHDHYYFNDLTKSVSAHKKILTKVKRIDGVIETKEYDYQDIKYALVSPFYGKGYPEEVQVMLQMRYHYQKTHFALENFVKASFIGLDCNGFVGGYIERRNAQDQWLRKSASKTSMPIKQLLGTRFFSSWDNFRPPGSNCLILGLCDKHGNVKDHAPDGGVGHIVITEPGTMIKRSTTGPVQVEAVESKGGKGLTVSTYTFEKMLPAPGGTAFFYVDRGVGNGKLYFRVTELL